MSHDPPATAADGLPRFHEFFGPALTVLTTGETMRSWDVVARVSDQLGLTADQRAQVIPSGQRRLDNRVTWALSYLFHAEAVRKPDRGVFQITDRGRDLIRTHPDGFSVDTLRQYEVFQAFQSRSKRAAGTRSAATTRSTDDSNETPLEQVSAAVEQLDADVAAELVQRLHAASPEFLEKAVLRLLVAMGYGGSDEAAVHLGGPGDGGFDGVINQDRLASAAFTSRPSATMPMLQSAVPTSRASSARCTTPAPSEVCSSPPAGSAPTPLSSPVPSPHASS